MRGVAAPAGVPRPILDRLAQAVQRTVEDPEFQKSAVQQNLPLRFLGLLFLEWRHLAAPQHADDVFPMIALADQRLRRLERLEVQAVLGFALVAVAAEAVLGEKWPNCPGKTPDARVIDDRRGRVRRHRAAGGGNPAHSDRRRGGRFRARGFLRTQRHSDSGETTNGDEEQ